jgi:hypothetical protein
VTDVINARATVQSAQQTVNSLQAYYHGKALDSMAMRSYQIQLTTDQQAVGRAQGALERARGKFEQALQEYQKLGGKVDYRQQLPP